MRDLGGFAGEERRNLCGDVGTGGDARGEPAGEAVGLGERMGQATRVNSPVLRHDLAAGRAEGARRFMR